MRTPGDDDDLVRGWLYTERLVADPAEILTIDRRDPAVDGTDAEAVIVTVAASVVLDHVIEHRSLTPTSACGLCGRVAIDRLDAGRAIADAHGTRPVRWSSELIAGLPAALLTAQTVFAATGGLHAAGLFDDRGAVQFVREDIGRHNAVDKVIGAALAAARLPDRCPILVVSGRVAFEIVQKAAVGGQAAVVAIGAPSDLAIDAARAAGLTLVGFARAGRFNVYAGVERIHASGAAVSAP
jgi:FdhD protein